MGADTGGVAVPFDGSRRTKTPHADVHELVVVPDRLPKDAGAGDDVVIDLRTGEPVLELRELTAPPANRLVNATAVQRAVKRGIDVVVASQGSEDFVVYLANGDGTLNAFTTFHNAAGNLTDVDVADVE